MKSYFKPTQGTGYSKESYQECVCDMEDFCHNLPFVPVWTVYTQGMCKGRSTYNGDIQDI